MASRASLSMLVTLELRERLNELSLLSNGMAPRGGHTESKTVGGKQEEVKLPFLKKTASLNIYCNSDTWVKCDYCISLFMLETG